MGDKNWNSIATPIERTDFDNLLDTLSRTQIVHAAETALFVGGAFAAGSVIVDTVWNVGYLPVGVYVAVPVLVAVTPLAIGRLGHSMAYAQAAWEIVRREDLNNSGKVGDVVIDAPEPQVREEVRVIPVAAAVKVIEGIPAQDLREFIETIPANGLSRRAWAGYMFRSGRPCTRQLYDQIMTMLTDKVKAIDGRGSGTDGHLVKGTDQIIGELGLGQPG